MAPVGKTYPPTLYAVGREKIKEDARAVGETNPLHLDHEAARAAGYADVVAPPMFAVVYCSPATGPAYFDPELALEFARLGHGGRALNWGALVVAGAEITAAVVVKTKDERAADGFYGVESVS